MTPLAGHVSPMLVIAEFLRQQGDEILFNTSELFRERAQDCGLRFLPLMGNANYDYHQLGELISESRPAASHIDLYNIYAKRMLGDRIPDQYRGLRQINDDENVDLVITEAGFWGILPLLILTKPRPPVLSCGMIAPMWHDPAFSVLTGSDDTPEEITAQKRARAARSMSL